MWYTCALVLVLSVIKCTEGNEFMSDSFDKDGGFHDVKRRDDERYAHPFALRVGDDYDQLNIVGLAPTSWFSNISLIRNNEIPIYQKEKDDREDIYRPCELDDWTCIRKFLAANSRCIPQHGPVPDPLYLKHNTVYLPLINVTLFLTKIKVQGLSNAKISEFYVNKDTRNLVLAITIKNLNVSTIAYFRYQRTAKETIVLHDFANGLYRSVTFTAVIPKVPHLRLDKADIHIDIEDGTPPFYIGPRALVSTDPDVIAAVATFVASVPLILREIYLLQTSLFTNIFIQTNLCDFGNKNYSF